MFSVFLGAEPFEGGKLGTLSVEMGYYRYRK